MPSILDAGALSTLAAVNEELKLTSDAGGAQDQFVERCVNTASAFIERHCGVTFRRTDAIVEKVKSFGTPVIRLARRPIVAITSIAIDEDTVDADDYFVEDAEAGKVVKPSGWPWTAAARRGITQPQIPGWEDASRIVVTYNGGFVTPAQVAAATFVTRTLPWDVEDACIQLAASRWRERGRNRNVDAQSHEASSLNFDLTGLPPGVRAVLAHYKRFPQA